MWVSINEIIDPIIIDLKVERVKWFSRHEAASLEK
jgi:hypothetical protein